MNVLSGLNPFAKKEETKPTSNDPEKQSLNVVNIEN